MTLTSAEWDLALDNVTNGYRILLGDFNGAFVGLSGGGAAAIAAGAFPVVTMAGVFVALGAGYAEARAIVQNEESSWGFAEGFVMGVLGWEWRNVKSLFYRHGVIRIYQSDEELNAIRVKAYDSGLKAGYLLASSLPEELQEAYVQGLRKLAGHPDTGDWTRNYQISFVIALASAYRKFVRA